MALQPPFRDAIALAVAAIAATGAIVLFGAAYNLLGNGFVERGQLSNYTIWAVRSAAPIALLGCLAAAPVLWILRRRGKLGLASAIGLFAVVALGVTVVEALVSPGIEALSPAQIAMFGGLYIVSGGIAGVAYWAVAIAPSNNTIERDARKSGARPSS